MKKCTKLTAIALLLAMLVMSAVSCGSGDSGSGAADTTASGETTPAETTPAETEPPISYKSANLPEKKYDGYKFRSVMTDQSKDYAWYHLDAEQNGDILNDAIYERNATIEEAFDVEISEILYENASCNNNIKNVILAGDDAFDIIFASMVWNHGYVQNDLIIDLNTVDYIDLKQQWWDQAVIRDLELNDHVYYVTGDISPNVDMRSYAMVFNKDMVEELKLDDPYQMVRDGKWVFETFKKYVTGVNADINGDGKMDYDDRWGFFSELYNTSMMFVSAGGEFVMPNKAHDGLEYNVLKEANINRLIASLEIMNDENVTLLANDYVSANGNSWTAASNWYAGGNALLRSSVLEPIPRDYRSMETDFGVLPYPKFDEAQDDYITLAGASGGRFISIPVIQKDIERTGIILEALAAESVNTVKTAFYDFCLTGKYVRDDESSEMLDIIFEGKKLDWGYIINVASMNSQITALEKAKNNDPVSAFTSLESQVNTLLTQYMEHY